MITHENIQKFTKMDKYELNHVQGGNAFDLFVTLVKDFQNKRLDNPAKKYY